MNLAECYQLLGLRSDASFDDVKASYRQLARRYHPDMSAGDSRTKDKFIEITTAYKSLLDALTEPDLPESAVSAPPQSGNGHASPANYQTDSSTAQSTPQPPDPLRKSVQLQDNPHLSPLEQQLKVNSYQQLQHFLKTQRFPRAIALTEGLSRRLPRDSEVNQWKAIVYQQWGRQLIRDRQPEKARIYLKKAISTDPQNRSLWVEVEKDFRAIEQMSS